MGVLGRSLDAALDRSVVGGYTSLGYALRKRAWAHPELPSLDGRTIAITGATSGIGRAAAQMAAASGARLILLVRDRARGEQLASEIAGAGGFGLHSVLECDLAHLRSVREAARSLMRAEPSLDVLINNAGVLPPRRELSADGYELTFATNLLGPFLLTEMLVPLLEPARGRIITVSSGGMYTQGLVADDLQMEHGDFDGVTAYARTKRAQVVLTELWAERLAPRGVTAHAMHPGWVDTPGVVSSLPRFHRVLGPALRSPEQGADTIVWLAGAPAEAIGTGGFWHDRRRRPTHLLPRTGETAGQRQLLWETLERLASNAAPSSGGASGRRAQTA